MELKHKVFKVLNEVRNHWESDLSVEPQRIYSSVFQSIEESNPSIAIGLKLEFDTLQEAVIFLSDPELKNNNFEVYKFVSGSAIAIIPIMKMPELKL